MDLPDDHPQNGASSSRCRSSVIISTLRRPFCVTAVASEQQPDCGRRDDFCLDGTGPVPATARVGQPLRPPSIVKVCDVTIALSSAAK
jgi:hypothetical protein